MLRTILKNAATIDLLADGALPLTTRFKLALFRNRSRTQGRRNRLQMASVRALRDLGIDIHGDGNDLCINGELRNTSINIRGNNNRIRIDSTACLTWTDISIIANDSEITVGASTTILGKPTQPNTLLARGEPSRITIGRDCMFSYGIEVRTSDSHPIFDGRGVHINPSADIAIGDHVWVGSRCMLLKGGNLGHGSVLAAASVLTRHIGERVIAAGIPAKVIREDIEWRR